MIHRIYTSIPEIDHLESSQLPRLLPKGSTANSWLKTSTGSLLPVTHAVGSLIYAEDGRNWGSGTWGLGGPGLRG